MRRIEIRRRKHLGPQERGCGLIEDERRSRGGMKSRRMRRENETRDLGLILLDLDDDGRVLRKIPDKGNDQQLSLFHSFSFGFMSL